MGVVIRVQQIAHESRVMGKAPVRVLIESQIQRGRSAVAHVVEILFKVGAAERLDRLLGQSFEIGVSFVAQVEARQLVIP